jgi:non-heme Fe2+,alpha-ketoglutarate-dependent halogenase
MPKSLTPAQIEQYRKEGCVFPIRVMPETEAAELRRRLEEFEQQTGGPLKGDLRHKSHLLFTWLAELVRHSSILDAVEDLHGPDLLCWTTNFFIKEAADPAFVTWHQESTYWGLSTPDVVTAWVAFTPATEANGAMEYIPGSHKLDQIPHRDTFAKHNLLTRGQEVMVEVDHSQRRIITLRPGEMSLHHVRLRSRLAAPTRRATGALALRSAISRRWWRSSPARTAPRSCVAKIATTILCRSRSRPAISTRNLWRFTGPSPSATPGSSIAAPKSPVTTSQRPRRSAVEPARRAG